MPDFFGAHLDPVHGINHDDGGIGDVEDGPGVGQEIIVTGGVGQVNRVFFVGIMVECGGDRGLALEFFGFEIEHRGAVVYFALTVGGAGAEKEGFGQGSLAAAAVADEGQVSDSCCFAGHHDLLVTRMPSTHGRILQTEI